MIIYIASPYGRRIGKKGSTLTNNVKRSIEAGRELILKGHTPFMPLLYHYVHKDWRKTPSEDVWHRICKAFLFHCQGVLRLEGYSIGADDEVADAKALGKKVFYSLEEVPDENT